MTIANDHEMLIVGKNVIIENDINCYDKIVKLFDDILCIDNINKKINCNENQNRYDIIRNNNESKEQYDITIDGEKIGEYVKQENKRLFSIGQSFIEITNDGISFCDAEDYTVNAFINNKFKFIVNEFLDCIQSDTDIINDRIKINMNFKFKDLNLKYKKIRDIDFSDTKTVTGEWSETLDLACVGPYDDNWSYNILMHNTELKNQYETKYKEILNNYEKNYVGYLVSHTHSDCIPCSH